MARCGWKTAAPSGQDGAAAFQIIDFFRLLSPVEAERLQGFDDNWTEGMPERMRYFCMGNALVVPMVTRMAKTLAGIVDKEP